MLNVQYYERVCIAVLEKLLIFFFYQVYVNCWRYCGGVYKESSLNLLFPRGKQDAVFALIVPSRTGLNVRRSLAWRSAG